MNQDETALNKIVQAMNRLDETMMQVVEQLKELNKERI